MSDSNQNKYLTIAEAAKLLRRSKDTIRRLCKKRELPGIRIGATYIFNREHLDRFLQPKKKPRL